MTGQGDMTLSEKTCDFNWIKEKKITIMVVKHWNRLPTEVIDVLFLGDRGGWAGEAVSTLI